MKESVGTAFLINIILVFLAVIGFLMIGFFGYSRAYKTKNKVIDIIERHETFDHETQAEIDEYYKYVGYATNRGGKKCKPKNDGSKLFSGTNYKYCVYQYPTGRGYYYSVTVYMTYNFPIVQSLIQIPVEGETKIIYEL